jgi:hypothetical protein
VYALRLAPLFKLRYYSQRQNHMEQIFYTWKHHCLLTHTVEQRTVARRAIAEAKQRSQRSVIGWVNKFSISSSSVFRKAL